MRDPHDIIIKPIITEDTMDKMAERKYTFQVDRRANKSEIKNIEKIFGLRLKRLIP